MKKFLLAAVAVLATATAANAASLVSNGGFEINTNGTGQLGFNTDASDWSTNGYNFLFFGNTADSDGANGVYGGLKLWGPANGAANGLSASPTGGYYVAADGAFGVAPITQVINGLVVGQTYNVGFDWAGAQQLGYDGPQTEQWEVSLGGPSQFTSIYSNPSHGFSGWKSEVFSFTATDTSSVLSFLAHGTPEGVPPFSLLDNVTLTAAAAVPEPATWLMMIAGVGVMGASLRRRPARAMAAA